MGVILFFEWLFVILIAIAVYVLTAIGLYKIGARNGVKNPWLAFVPILQYYVVGSICEEYVLFGYRIKYLNWMMCIIMFFALMSGGSFSLNIISLAATVLSLMILHKFFYLFNPQKAMVYTLLSLLGGIPIAIIIYILKDTPMVMSAGAYPYPFAEKR